MCREQQGRGEGGERSGLELLKSPAVSGTNKTELPCLGRECWVLPGLLEGWEVWVVQSGRLGDRHCCDWALEEMTRRGWILSLWTKPQCFFGGPVTKRRYLGSLGDTQPHFICGDAEMLSLFCSCRKPVAWSQRKAWDVSIRCHNADHVRRWLLNSLCQYSSAQRHCKGGFCSLFLGAKSLSIISAVKAKRRSESDFCTGECWKFLLGPLPFE